MRKFIALFLLFSILIFGNGFAQEPTKLLRFPAIHSNQIVFTYASDLYTVPTNGGVARKLTNHDGFEMFARFSPDGNTLAFTGQYDGNTEVYLMPAQGGVPERITFTATLGRDDVSDRMGPNNIVMGWHPDGKQVIFRSRMIEFNDFKGQLFLAPVKGDLPVELPLSRGGFCSYSPDGKKLAYNRVFREFRTWKRYRGGMADDIWIFDFASKKSENITNNPAQDIIPMWHGNKIYFLSDRDENKRMNLFVFDLTTRGTTKLTEFVDFDIKFPSLGNDAIVFENSGEIYRLDMATEKAEKVEIFIQEDHLGARGGLKDVSKSVSNFEISPDGKRALFGARGEVFTIPAENGPTRNLTTTSSVHERNSLWSPDGKWVAYISDATGEDEIYIIAQDGKSKARQVTKNADTYKFEIRWSPDSKKILWGDKRLRLQFVEILTGKMTVVDQATAWEFRDYTWAPDSKWIAYTKIEEETMNRIFLYSLEQNKAFPVTDGWYSVGNPAFSADGKFLFFVSDRDFNPIYSATEWNHAYQDMSAIYLLTLTKDTKSPFEPKSDEVTIQKEEKPEKKADTKKKDDEKKDEKPEIVVKVDLENVLNRVVKIPVSVANYWHLTSVGDQLYYQRKSSKDEKPLLLMYDLKDLKETELGQINGYEISVDQKKMLVSQNGKYAILDLPKGKIEIKETLDLSGLEVNLDRTAEWNQIYQECWRQMREFFYAPNMHGVNWPPYATSTRRW